MFEELYERQNGDGMTRQQQDYLSEMIAKIREEEK